MKIIITRKSNTYRWSIIEDHGLVLAHSVDYFLESADAKTQAEKVKAELGNAIIEVVENGNGRNGLNHRNGR